MEAKTFRRSIFKNTLNLIKLYWEGDQKKTAIWLTLLIVTTIVFSVYNITHLNKWYQAFYIAIEKKDLHQIVRQLLVFLLIILIAGILLFMENYLIHSLRLKWRRWLTKHCLNEWFEKKVYYKTRLHESYIDNPDQRISEDIFNFVRISSDVFKDIVRSICTIVVFTVILWHLSKDLTNIPIPGYLVFMTILYSIIGYISVHIIGKNLRKFKYNQHKYEADFRYDLVKVRENSESIATYSGEKYEHNILTSLFNKISNNNIRIFAKERYLIVFSYLYNELSNVFSIAISLPSFVSGIISFGTLIQICEACKRVNNSLSYFLNSYFVIAELESVVDRLSIFLRHVNVKSKNTYSFQIKKSKMLNISINNLEVFLPNKTACLLKCDDLTLQFGQHVLIDGPNGIGKSTFLKVLAGIWPYVNGLICTPERCAFVPQKMYFTGNSLTTILSYPHDYLNVSNKDLFKIMKIFEIDYLFNQMDRNHDWNIELSHSEQQRIILIRALLHKPKWLLIDEQLEDLSDNVIANLLDYISDSKHQITVISTSNFYNKNNVCKITINKDDKMLIKI